MTERKVKRDIWRCTVECTKKIKDHEVKIKLENEYDGPVGTSDSLPGVEEVMARVCDQMLSSIEHYMRQRE